MELIEARNGAWGWKKGSGRAGRENREEERRKKRGRKRDLCHIKQVDALVSLHSAKDIGTLLVDGTKNLAPLYPTRTPGLMCPSSA
jgi:hypothetical protein